MILEALQKNLISAQKARDGVRVGVFRFLMSAIKNKEIELRSTGEELTDEQVLKVIKKQIKQRKDSIESYKQGNREDLVAKESEELEILEEIYSFFDSNDQ